MYKILVVDDEENLRLLYERELLKDGYEIELASSGEEALSKFRENPPHLVVLDIKMPGMDGVEVLSKILSIDNKMPIVLNTAYASYQDNFTTWAADAYVVKSSDLSELKSRVRSILKDRYSE
jgi:DNA-binding response OmpR family regulator